MFSPHSIACLLLIIGCSCHAPSLAANPIDKNKIVNSDKTSHHKATYGKIAAYQIRYIATHFPGRMAGSPAELLAAEYINQQFKQMGYQSNLRNFHARYLYTSDNGEQHWNTLDATSVIAAKAGVEKKQIIIMTHFDTYTPQSDKDLANNLGGLTLQGVDDNASGVGVMLELAEHLKNISTLYSVRFIALSAEEIGSLGAKNYLQRMSEQEKENTLLVINVESLIIGDRLYFNSGHSTSNDIAKKTRDQALIMARHYGIPAYTNPGKNDELPKSSGCCADHEIFNETGIPVLLVEAANWTSDKKDSSRQQDTNRYFPQGIGLHQGQLDNLQYLDKHLSGRIEQRSRDTVQLLLPLIKQLANAR